MSTTNRVFITGRGALTASGANADETWSAILSGESGISEITQWDLSQWVYKLGGELKDFNPARMLPDRKLIKVISRQDVMGINAAVQAVEHSQIIDYRNTLVNKDSFNDKTAVFVGSPGNKYFQQYDFLPLLAKSKGDMKFFADHLFEVVHPMWLLRILPNNVLAYTGITYGFKGPNHNVANHAVGGTQALLEAYHAISCGQAERAVVVAYDIAIEPQSIFYYKQLGVLSHRHLKPFDKEHDGTILAEGAAALVLESEASVKARGATCYGEIMGGFANTEGEGLFSLDASGEKLHNLINDTLEMLELSPKNVGVVVAHGNGNIKSDASESYAIQKAFNQQSTPVTALKWSMGHTVCASGLIDAVMTSFILQSKCVPGISNLQSCASDCEGLLVSSKHQPTKGSHALIINRGFGSMDSCLVMKSCD